MTILITGGAGYIGSVTVELLHANGRPVVVLDNLSTGHREAVDARVPFYQGDVGDRALVRRIVAEHGVDSCIHFAALSIVSHSMADPGAYLHNNVVQGLRLFEALRERGVRHLVLSSTAAVYGEPVADPIDESHPTVPTSPYGLSKLMLEQALTEYDRAYGLRAVALRYFNAAGATASHGEAHDPETHLIPNVLSCAAGDRASVQLYGDDFPTADGTAIRDYIHVMDLARAHVKALEHLERGGGSARLNLGAGRGYSVLEVVEAARRATGRTIPIERVGRRPGDPARLVAGTQRARALLAWQATHRLEDIIASAWQWKQLHPRGHDAAPRSRLEPISLA